MPPAPPPPPPPMGVPPALGGGNAPKPPANAMVGRDALLGDIRKGARLKKAETNDRSAPQVGGSGNSGSSGAATPMGLPPSIPGSRPQTSTNTPSSEARSAPNVPQIGGLFANGIPKLKRHVETNSGPRGNASSALSVPNLPASRPSRRTPSISSQAPSIPSIHTPPIPSSSAPPIPGSAPPLPNSGNNLKVPPRIPNKSAHVRSTSTSSINSTSSQGSRNSTNGPPAPPGLPPLPTGSAPSIPSSRPLRKPPTTIVSVSSAPPPGPPPLPGSSAPSIPSSRPSASTAPPPPPPLPTLNAPPAPPTLSTPSSNTPPPPGPPPLPSSGAPTAPKPPAMPSSSRSKTTSSSPPPNPGGGLPFLAEIQKKRDDSYVVDSVPTDFSASQQASSATTPSIAAPFAPVPTKSPPAPTGNSLADMIAAKAGTRKASNPPIPIAPPPPSLPTSSAPTPPPTPPSLPQTSAPSAPAPPAPPSLPKSSAPSAPTPPSAAGGLPFLAEIQKKRDDRFVIDESSQGGSPASSSLSIPQAPAPKASAPSPPPFFPQSSAPSIPQAAAPRVSAPPPPPSPSFPQASAPFIPQAPAPSAPKNSAPPPPLVSSRTSAPAPPSPAPSVPSQPAPAPSSPSSSSSAPAPPISAQNHHHHIPGGSFKQRLFGKSAPHPPPTSSSNVDANSNFKKIDSSAYTMNGGNSHTKVDIDDSRFRFVNQNDLPKPRFFEGKQKLYPSGRGSSVPLDLSLYQ